MTDSSNGQKVAVIAGAGPAGLTSALELLRRSNIVPVVFEADVQVGGISKTINYRGNRMDLGGHRFFSKSDWVMRWWQEILPLSGPETSQPPLRITYQGSSREVTRDVPGSSDGDAAMLVRQRLSRILYRRRFFDYPLSLNADTLKRLGLAEAALIGMSYIKAKIVPRVPENSLEDFFVNRFGVRLYQTFFKDYTEKVWGVPCAQISAEWGAQRIKGLSITKALVHSLTKSFGKTDSSGQKNTETSLIEHFLYPRLGPGQMWEEVARQVTERGGTIHLQHRVIGLERKHDTIKAVHVQDPAGAVRRVPCDHFVSTMPVNELVACLQPESEDIARIANALPYRDFMTVGLLVRSMNSLGQAIGSSANGMPRDNWIYIQEPDVRLGRLQIFNNWSPSLVADPTTIWLGLEYFCRAGDELWSMKDADFIDFAAAELAKLGLIDRADVIDGTLVRVPKAYPAYFGAYSEFGTVRSFLDRHSNLYPIGRNGMHRYNNQDHSMLAASAAVTSMMNEGRGKAAIWQINSEDSYHEEIDKPQVFVPAAEHG